MAIVADHKTLAAMERKGFIVRNGKGRDRERHWTGEMVPVITVAPGPKLEQWYTPFEFNGVMYRIKYFSGCFKPFVVRLNVPQPDFV